MRWAAMLSMLVDHVGLVFFPDEPAWRIVGRLAFPVYAYSIVQGYARTRSFRRYAARLALIGLAAQLPYMAAFRIMGVNTVGTLLAGLLAMAAADRFDRAGKPFWKWPMFAAVGVLLEALRFDYGAYGLSLILIYRYGAGRPYATVAAHAALNLVALVAKSWVLQLWSLVPTILLAFGPATIADNRRPAVPLWLWRSFYPAHLAALAVVRFAAELERGS
ncbi:MAG: hypothetical protein BLM47_09470 [Candidatus Reconcilbacillus cellulovorans]|uniref:Conjugal transfer protein TraX n=1 Tax=Candidatus Reconcilbacillus cellulovorans TaxID=1906605 RepID=A0A2A6DZ14_9BACL|nr:MAG: hypothetical protein BLM47_09470 [Candidatus Reconcilbacillus cellulovorans]